MCLNSNAAYDRYEASRFTAHISRPLHRKLSIRLSCQATWANQTQMKLQLWTPGRYGNRWVSKLAYDFHDSI